MSQTLLIIDPETDFLEWAERHLGSESVKIATASTAAEGLRLFSELKPDLVIAEYQLQPGNGIELLKKLRMTDPQAFVVLSTAWPPTDAVIEAMKLGAFDFLRKETLPYDLRPVVESALKSREAARVSTEATAAGPPLELGDVMIGQSQAMQGVFKLIGRISRSDAVVLITGESGCGKEVVARAVQRFSMRSTRNFVAINCAAIPEALLESELFGHEKGSFTGAVAQRAGRFEQCDGGTLFLDEIGEMPMHVQTKILRVLQEGEFSRVGGNETLRTDVRIIAATNRNLEKEVERGKFREDLFYRLNVVRVHLPPLRERPDDTLALARFFLNRIAKKRNQPGLRFSDEALALMKNYNWPGNVRELENTVQRAALMSHTDVITGDDIPLLSGTNDSRGRGEGPAAMLLEQALNGDAPAWDWMLHQLAEAALSHYAGSPEEAARALGLKTPAFKKLLTPVTI